MRKYFLKIAAVATFLALPVSYGTASEKPVPRANENAGYILYEKDGDCKIIVPADGTLHQPTGMAVKDGFLFVCDSAQLFVFDLSNLQKKPQRIVLSLDCIKIRRKGDVLSLGMIQFNFVLQKEYRIVLE